MTASSRADARVRDHHINRSERSLELPGGFAQSIRTYHVAGKRHRASSVTNDFCFNFPQKIHAAREQTNCRTAASELQRQTTPDSARGAGDQNYFVFPVHESEIPVGL